MKGCAWCCDPLPGGARSDSVFCGRVCRQRAWRLRRRRAELEARPRRASTPLRLAYADPPYPGLARRYYGAETSFAGEVDHAGLIERLGAYDGWALSTGAYALRDLLPLCPQGALVCPWIKPRRRRRSGRGVHNHWEPLIVVPGRRLCPSVGDWLYAAPARLGGSSLRGRKPLAFVAWLFACLGALPGDELEDLFPGSGTVGRAWAEVSRLESAAPSRRGEDLGDGLGIRSATRRAGASGDASRLGRRRRVPLGVVC